MEIINPESLEENLDLIKALSTHYQDQKLTPVIEISIPEFKFSLKIKAENEKDITTLGCMFHMLLNNLREGIERDSTDEDLFN